MGTMLALDRTRTCAIIPGGLGRDGADDELPQSRRDNQPRHERGKESMGSRGHGAVFLECGVSLIRNRVRGYPPA
jgi:hypothetical protein